MKFNTLIFQQQKPYLKLLLVSDGQMFGCRGDNLWSHIYELLITVFLSLLGDSRKYPYPTMGGMSILTPPLPSEIPKCLSPPCPPNSKIANPPSPPEFSTFVSDPLEFLFVCLNLQTNEKLSLFPSAKEFCSQFLVGRSSKCF